jgi:DNA-binding FadR family transcriptional regulator
MSNLPPYIQARRAIEDRAAQLGAERRELDGRTEANVRAVIDLLHEADGTGVSYDQLAQLIGVSRQTLYHWREAVARKERHDATQGARSRRAVAGLGAQIGVQRTP